MAVPATIRAGDTISWIEAATTDNLGNAVSSASWTLAVFLRTNTASEGATVSGVARSDGGWDCSISATTSGAFDAGTWYWQALATNGSTKLTIGSGSFEVLPSLAYSSTPGAFDGRSQAEEDLAAVQAAIRAIVSGKAKQYTIGSRSFTNLDLPALMEREAQLKGIVARERKAEKIAAGLGDPQNLYVRFG